MFRLSWATIVIVVKLTKTATVSSIALITTAQSMAMTPINLFMRGTVGITRVEAVLAPTLTAPVRRHSPAHPMLVGQVARVVVLMVCVAVMVAEVEERRVLERMVLFLLVLVQLSALVVRDGSTVEPLVASPSSIMVREVAYEN
jgi:hypothetical protein